MIRKIKDNDISAILEIWLNENIRAHSFIDKSYWISNFEYVKNALQQTEVYVYERGGDIVGFIGLNRNYIEGIFVGRAFQSGGIGSALIEYAKAKHSVLTLNVYEKNKRALSFYIKQGFKITDKETDINTNETELKMTWKKKQ